MTSNSSNPIKMGKLCVILNLIIIIILHLIIGNNNFVNAQVDLCFLEDGSSSETFTINEAVPVGSIIGLLKVNSYSIFFILLYFFVSVSFVF